MTDQPDNQDNINHTANYEKGREDAKAIAKSLSSGGQGMPDGLPVWYASADPTLYILPESGVGWPAIHEAIGGVSIIHHQGIRFKTELVKQQDAVTSIMNRIDNGDGMPTVAFPDIVPDLEALCASKLYQPGMMVLLNRRIRHTKKLPGTESVSCSTAQYPHGIAPPRAVVLDMTRNDVPQRLVAGHELMHYLQLDGRRVAKDNGHCWTERCLMNQQSTSSNLCTYHTITSNAYHAGMTGVFLKVGIKKTG